MTIAKYLDGLMKNSGITAYQLSKETGIPQQSISNWRLGRTKPNTQNINKLAEWFNVPVNSFIEKDNVPDQYQPIGHTDDTPEIIIMNRGVHRLSPEDQKKAVRILKAAFEDVFDEP